MENNEYNGFWYLPNDKNKKLSGMLIIDSTNKISLELYGIFNNEDIRTVFPIILGVTTTVDNITLENCLCMSSGLKSGIPYRKYEISSCYLNALLISDNDRLINNLCLSIDNLDKWTAFKVFHTTHNKNEFSITYEQPNPVIIKFDNFQLSIIAYNSHSLSSSKTSIKNNVDIILILENKLKINDIFLKYLVPLERFFCFAMGDNIFIRNITTSITSMSTTKIILSRRLSSPIEINTYDMLFTMNDISSNIELIFNNWFYKVSTQFIGAYQSFFSMLKTSHIEQKFYLIINALENYHRVADYKSYIEPPDDYKLKINNIIDTAPDEYKKWLKENLNFSNEPRLRNRLSELFNDVIVNDILSSEITKFINDDTPYNDKLIKFISRIVFTRNKLTHKEPLTDKEKKKFLNESEFYPVTCILIKTLKILFYKELGFSNELIKKCIQKDHHYLEFQY